MKLHQSEPLPKPAPNQHLIQVLAVGINPVDYKVAETPFVGWLAVKLPSIPGYDLAGHIIAPADGSNLEPGQLVFGTAGTDPMAGGALAEYIVAPANTICPISSKVSPLSAGAAPVAALTAYGSVVPYIRSGSRVFVNGGSGGTGTYCIQIAKAIGAHVTVSCSTSSIELCRSLGADEILDYTSRPVLDQLREVAKAARPFDHVVDNVFSDPTLYFQAHTYTTADAKFVEVASAPSLAFVRFALTAFLWPKILGGGQRAFVMPVTGVEREHLQRIADWMSDGTVRTVTDQIFPMKDAVEAFKRVKSGRVKGKVVVDVAGQKS